MRTDSQNSSEVFVKYIEDGGIEFYGECVMEATEPFYAKDKGKIQIRLLYLIVSHTMLIRPATRG